MPRVLALDWDGSNALLVVAEAGKAKAVPQRALSWPEDQAPTPANAAGWGQRLKAKLAELGVAPAPLLVAVGRDKLIVKEVKHPAVAPHEEPAVVRFQAVKELTDAAEDVVLDYHPLPTPAGALDRRAMAVAVRKDVLRGWQAVADAAGLKLAAVSPRLFGAIAAAAHSPAPPARDAAHAVLTLGTKGGEFAVALGDVALFARTIPAPATASETSLLAELRRNLAVYAGQVPGHPVAALHVAELPEPMEGFALKLQETLGLPVTEFDPLPGIELPPGPPRAAFAGAAGLPTWPKLAVPINFVKPREPKAPTDPNRRPLLLAGALAAAVVMGLGMVGYSFVSAKSREIAALNAQRSDLDGQLALLDRDARTLKALEDWTGAEVVWLDELYDLTARFPDLAKLRLVQFTGEPIAAPAVKGADAANPLAPKPVQKYAARVLLTGLIGGDDKPVVALKDETVGDKFYNVAPKATGPNATGIKESFERQFTLKYEIEKRPADQYKRSFTATPPERRRGGGGGMNMFDMFMGGAP